MLKAKVTIRKYLTRKVTAAKIGSCPSGVCERLHEHHTPSPVGAKTRQLHVERGATNEVSTDVGKEEQDWGKATASLKKAGEVQWDVSLNAGKSVKLVLQYEVAFPTGERVAQVF